MSFLLLLLVTVAFFIFVISVYKVSIGFGSDGTGAACEPDAVLSALQWEVKGTFAAGRFEGMHRDRKVEIRIQGGHYRIAIEGTPELGDLEGREALARMELLARSPDALKLAAIPDWQAILRVFHANPFRFEGGRLISTAAFGGGVLGPHEEATRLKRLLDRLVEVTAVAQFALSLRARVATDTRCPYCHGDFEGGLLQITGCPKCGARHHVDCFVEHGKCAVFACSAQVPQGLRDLSGPGKPQGGSIRSV